MTGGRRWPVAAGIALGLVLALSVLVWRGRRVGEARIDPALAPLLPEASGALASVVMHYVPKIESMVEPSYTDFLRAVSPDVRVVMVMASEPTGSDRAKLDAMLRRIDPSGSLAARTEIVQSEGPISTWSKDRALVTAAPADGRAAMLVEPSEPRKDWVERHNDWLTVPQIARASSGRFASRVAPFDFDAGDFIVDGGRLIVDTNLLDKNRRRGVADVADLARRLGLYFRMPVTVLGRDFGDTPRHHLAMYMTTLDPGVVLVGDPAAARAILGDAWLPGAQSGDTDDPLAADFTSETIARFDRAADELRRAGYRVERIVNVPFDDKTYVSYTNGVFEVRGGRRIAYMPVYGFDVIDAAARSTYERLGWEVRSIRVRSVYPHHGTIGCLVNVLSRTQLK
jgi:hypothetical protein